MNMRKELANALREHLRTFPTGDRLAMLRANPVISNLAIPDDALMKAWGVWETELLSKSDDELIMVYFSHPASGEPILTLTETDAILEKDPDRVKEILKIVGALEVEKRMMYMDDWPF